MHLFVGLTTCGRASSMFLAQYPADSNAVPSDDSRMSSSNPYHHSIVQTRRHGNDMARKVKFYAARPRPRPGRHGIPPADASSRKAHTVRALRAGSPSCFNAVAASHGRVRDRLDRSLADFTKINWSCPRERSLSSTCSRCIRLKKLTRLERDHR